MSLPLKAMSPGANDNDTVSTSSSTSSSAGPEPINSATARATRLEDVRNLIYSDRLGGPGLYSGELDKFGRPHGLGKMSYDNSAVKFKGSWNNGVPNAMEFQQQNSPPEPEAVAQTPTCGAASVCPGGNGPMMEGMMRQQSQQSLMGGLMRQQSQQPMMYAGAPAGPMMFNAGNMAPMMYGNPNMMYGGAAPQQNYNAMQQRRGSVGSVPMMNYQQQGGAAVMGQQQGMQQQQHMQQQQQQQHPMINPQAQPMMGQQGMQQGMTPMANNRSGLQ